MTKCPITGDQLVELPRFFTSDDAHSRLAGTILTYAGRAVKVQAVSNSIVLFNYCTEETLDSSSSQHVHMDSEKLDISSPSLGYVNSGNRVYYARRYPKRRWKNGLDNGSVYLTANGDLTEESALPFNAVNLSAFGKMIENNYPSIPNILKEANENVRKVEGAFHRKWSLGNIDRAERTALLFYKGSIVGHVSWEGILVPAKVSILPDFYHSAYIETLISAGLTVK